MAYNEFAYFYDELNAAADYDALFSYIRGELTAHGADGCAMADFGCGTGELTLMFSQCGYDMIAIDLSEEMLSVLREKADELGLTGKILMLRQDLTQLDLYGTIQAAISTFDTLNHIGPERELEKAIRNAALFMEKDGVFVFDMNTPYKHKYVLGNEVFDLDAPDAVCQWTNQYHEQDGRVDLHIEITYKEDGEIFEESFSEYSYSMDVVRSLLEKYGFVIARIADGETFGDVCAESQRWIITAIKQYTQEKECIINE